jgi:thioredoxin reductase (NADPH)
MAEDELRAVAFPTLNETQMTSLEHCSLTSLRRYRDGEKLFEAGDIDYKFFVVKSGKVEILDRSGDTPKTITVGGPGQFTGDATRLVSGRSAVSSIAQGDIEVLEISTDSLRQLLNAY